MKPCLLMMCAVIAQIHATVNVSAQSGSQDHTIQAGEVLSLPVSAFDATGSASNTTADVQRVVITVSSSASIRTDHIVPDTVASTNDWRAGYLWGLDKKTASVTYSPADRTVHFTTAHQGIFYVSLFMSNGQVSAKSLRIRVSNHLITAGVVLNNFDYAFPEVDVALTAYWDAGGGVYPSLDLGKATSGGNALYRDLAGGAAPGVWPVGSFRFDGASFKNRRFFTVGGSCNCLPPYPRGWPGGAACFSFTSSTNDLSKTRPGCYSGSGQSVAAVQFFEEIPPSDLRVVSFASTTNGEVAFQFENTSSPVPLGFWVVACWAKGPFPTSELIGSPVVQADVPSGFSGISPQWLIPAFRLASAQADATHLLLLVDPDNKVVDENRKNNFAFLPRLDFVALEVNQGVQDWNNSVQLVEGRHTLVRGFVKRPDNKNSNPISVANPLLHGRTVTGQPLPGSPLTGSRFVAWEAKEANINRTNLDTSANFILPLSWLSGTNTFRLQITNAVVIGSPQDQEVRRDFFKVPKLKVHFSRVKTLSAKPPDPKDVMELATRLEAIYPLPAEGITLDQDEFFYLLPEPDSSLGFILLNQSLSLFGNAEKTVLTYGVLRPSVDPWKGLPARAIDIPGHVASGKLSYSRPTSYYRHTHAHELGHLLSEEHTTDSMLGQNKDGYWQGHCFEIADHADNFPYWENGLAHIGPMGSDIRQHIYGYDKQLKVVVDPRRHFELMSYCSTAGKWEPDSYKWISKFTYVRIMLDITARFGTPAKVQAMSSYDCAFIRGLVSGSNLNVNLLPVVQFQSSRPPMSASQGDHALRLFNPQGQLLYTLPFTPQRVIPEEGDGAEDLWTFNLVVPMSPDVQHLDIVRNPGPAEQLAFRVNRSAHAPTLAFNSPEPSGPLIAPFTLRWQENDLDGDALTYQVEYSRDGGQSWRIIAADWGAPQIELDPASLKGTTNGHFRITAIDDLNSAVAVTKSPFIISNKPPELVLHSPEPGAALYGGGQVVFDAVAIDMEDGLLEGASVKWSSDLSGPLGDGPELILPISALKEGRHQITVVATDSGGLTNATAFALDVSYLIRPLLVRLPGATSNEFKLRLFGDEAAVHRLEASSDLQSWGPIATNITGSTLDYTETLSPSQVSKFFRASSTRRPATP